MLLSFLLFIYLFIFWFLFGPGHELMTLSLPGSAYAAELNPQSLYAPFRDAKSKQSTGKAGDLSEVTPRVRRVKANTVLKCHLALFFRHCTVSWNYFACLASDTVTSDWQFSHMERSMASLWRTNSLPTFWKTTSSVTFHGSHSEGGVYATRWLWIKRRRYCCSRGVGSKHQNVDFEYRIREEVGYGIL